jgi:hypothetical protein
MGVLQAGWFGMVMVANRPSHYATSDMPGMKADSKGFPSGDFFAILP